MGIISDVVIVALLSGVFSIITASITSQSKKNADNIINNLDSVKDEMLNIRSELIENKEIGLANRSGLKYIQRYRLYVEMTADIKRGYTTLGRLSEIGKLFESYSSLDGNGEIHALYEIFIKLPIKND